MHESITASRILAAAEESMFGIGNPGFCLKCGEDAEGVEPDARHYVCEICGTPAVCGVEEFLYA